MGVTLINKWAFKEVKFHYPIFLSFVHMLCNSVGSELIFWSLRRDEARLKQRQGEELPVGIIQRWLGKIERRDLDSKGRRLLWMFSVIFTLNIAIGNVSLRFVSVNFNQVMRSLVPGLAILFGRFLGKSTSYNKVIAVIPVVIGVAMSCFGEMYMTALGFFYTVLCICLAAGKVVASGEMLTGSNKLHPVDLLGHMAPLASVQMAALSLLSGEVYELVYERPDLRESWYPFCVIMVSGLCAFTLNVCSLMANKLTSPLTLCIAANVKQVVMIAVSTILFDVPITPLNGAGIIVVLLGSARYSYVSVIEKEAQSKAAKESPFKPSKKGIEHGDLEHGQQMTLVPPKSGDSIGLDEGIRERTTRDKGDDK
eukprot:CAMPEP_0194028504 /NCGR_PEP_ID=MMETSP0009_2-20130614/2446_1 /TAXON_ID=210454 /ORGANISM="Grammatophora oceanica, Strain CCMP 410" /LENGTH=367 /DNA_ID=CAMNT_0038667913 /DNA_START=136 /DNA_END=1239 /DNA_ORIENTATION=+